MRKNNPVFIILHHTSGTDKDPLTDTSHHTWEIVNEWHKKLWNFESSLGMFMGYHYFIDRKGIIIQGRDDLEEGAHTIGLNTSSIGICLAGNFDRSRDWANSFPIYKQRKSLLNLIIELQKKYNIPIEKIKYHRNFANKTCPGKNIPNNFISNLFLENELEIRISVTKQKIAEIQGKILVLLKGRKDNKETV